MMGQEYQTVFADFELEAYIDLFDDGLYFASFGNKEKECNSEQEAREWIQYCTEEKEENDATFSRKYECNEKI